MKIIKAKPAKLKTITIRVPEDLLQRIDSAREKADMLREPFIRAILRQVLDDKAFVLRVGEET